MSIMRDEYGTRTAAVALGDDLRPWPVYWSAVWVAALTGVALALVFGLLGITLGVGMPSRGVRATGLGGALMSVLGAFLAFAAAGWIAGKITSTRRSELAMLHAGIAWLVAVPILLLLAGFGSAALFGPWYSGLAGTPVWATTPAAILSPEAATAARMAAGAALAALLLSLVGAVIGGWMAAGEPMTLTYHRTREHVSRQTASV
jgi:ABC-type transport system involved in multi-copper enzyme maturation permease subunit